EVVALHLAQLDAAVLGPALDGLADADVARPPAAAAHLVHHHVLELEDEGRAHKDEAGEALARDAAVHDALAHVGHTERLQDGAHLLDDVAAAEELLLGHRAEDAAQAVPVAAAEGAAV